MGDKPAEVESENKPIIIRNTTDLQRLKLEKLMKNPDKPVIIPEKPKERGVPVVPDFVRNVMGSSAGAGSGEFHVYRHLRRKEYARQRYMKEKGEREKQDSEYHQKLEDNKKKAAEKTAKKRQKRLKRKQKMKGKGKKLKVGTQSSQSDDGPDSTASDSSSNEDEMQSDVPKADENDLKSGEAPIVEERNLPSDKVTKIEGEAEGKTEAKEATEVENETENDVTT